MNKNFNILSITKEDALSILGPITNFTESIEYSAINASGENADITYSTAMKIITSIKFKSDQIQFNDFQINKSISTIDLTNYPKPLSINKNEIVFLYSLKYNEKIIPYFIQIEITNSIISNIFICFGIS